MRFRDVEATGPYFVKPYLLKGFEREEELNGENTAHTANRRWRRKVRLDVKHKT